MKLTVFFLIIILCLLVACGDNSVETVQMPMVAGLSKPTEVLFDIPESTITPLPTVDQHDEIAAYPGSGETAENVAIVVPPTTAPPTAYPGLVVTEALSQTDQPAIEATATPDAYPGSTAAPTGTVTFGYEIVNVFPHDPGSYIQGLVVDNKEGTLLEGSGLWGESSLRRVDLETGAVSQMVPLAEQFFGEGITLFEDRIIQLTWKQGVGFIYDSTSFSLIEIFNYGHEGWGITHDGQQLIVSDGTDTIYFWDPETLQEIGRIQVYDEFGPVILLNELEYINGEICANVWQTDMIVCIDPESGRVTSRIDLTGLLPDEDRIGNEGVLNGIAYDSQEGRLYVTGKRWPTLFEIELLEMDDSE